MLTVEIRHRGAGEAQTYQGVGQRFDQIATGDHLITLNDPGRSYDHGQLRVEIEVGIQRPERRVQRFRRDFSQRRASHQLGHDIDGAGRRDFGHGQLLL
ncbi:hypothetical protein [Pseudomonas sp. IT-P395]|uniref:hypothetical protein n=1 Tax=Pseudomonas sp. IT-P395 TaxID=3026459 RepID=UPI0039E194F8